MLRAAGAVVQALLRVRDFAFDFFFFAAGAFSIFSNTRTLWPLRAMFTCTCVSSMGADGAFLVCLVAISTSPDVDLCDARCAVVRLLVKINEAAS